MSEPEFKPKFFWLQMLLRMKDIFPQGNSTQICNCWSLSPTNSRFIACQNYFRNYASRFNDFYTYRVLVNIQFIPGEVKQDWCCDAFTRKKWLMSGKSSNSVLACEENYLWKMGLSALFLQPLWVKRNKLFWLKYYWLHAPTELDGLMWAVELVHKISWQSWNST